MALGDSSTSLFASRPVPDFTPLVVANSSGQIRKTLFVSGRCGSAKGPASSASVRNLSQLSRDGTHHDNAATLRARQVDDDIDDMVSFWLQAVHEAYQTIERGPEGIELVHHGGLVIF